MQCPTCGDPVSPGAIYCCRRCKEKAHEKRRMIRYREDPEYRQQVRDRQTRREREKGVKPMIRVAEVCQVPECGQRHVARGFCGSHYQQDRRRRGLDPENTRQTFPLYGLIRRGGNAAPELRRVVCWITVGVLVACPDCRGVLGARSPSRRFCPYCGLTAELNAEEVEALPHFRQEVP